MYEIFFFDIDGTLRSFETHEVPASAREALARLRGRGAKVIIATGRARRSLASLEGLTFDERLRGGGAQVHWELAFFLVLGRKGTILYDPSILVDHFPAIRHDADQRDSFSALASRDAAFNETLVLLENHSAPKRVAFVAWAFAVAHRTVTSSSWSATAPTSCSTRSS